MNPEEIVDQPIEDLHRELIALREVKGGGHLKDVRDLSDLVFGIALRQLVLDFASPAAIPGRRTFGRRPHHRKHRFAGI